MKHAPSEKHTLSVLVDNESGVLARIVGLFSARGYNIDSLTVADITPDHAISRITIVTNGPPSVIDQIEAQLERLVPVHKVTDLTTAGPHVERELALIKVSGTGDKRVEALRVAEIFRAHVVDTTTTSFVFELTGAPEKINSFVVLMRDLGLVEVGRSGVVGMIRGAEGADTPRPSEHSLVRATPRQVDEPDASVLAGRTRGRPLDDVGLPGQSDVTDALLAFLYRQNDWIKPSAAYSNLSEHFGLTSAALAATMNDGRNHWENRVQWARKELVDRGLLDNSRHGFWKLFK